MAAAAAAAATAATVVVVVAAQVGDHGVAFLREKIATEGRPAKSLVDAAAIAVVDTTAAVAPLPHQQQQFLLKY